jgi:hypothetical protein
MWRILVAPFLVWAVLFIGFLSVKKWREQSLRFIAMILGYGLAAAAVAAVLLYLIVVFFD